MKRKLALAVAVLSVLGARAASAGALVNVVIPAALVLDTLPAKPTAAPTPASPVVPVGIANFEAEVKQSKLPVLLVYCDPSVKICSQLLPIIEELATQNQGKAKFGYVNIAPNSVDRPMHREDEVPHFYLWDGKFRKMLLVLLANEQGDLLGAKFTPAE